MAITMPLYERIVNARLAVELAIIHFNPEISNEELLTLREQIILDTFRNDKPNGSSSMYVREYYLYARKCYV